jgi:ABC-2 type transport system ATP-binding protein
MPIIDTRGLRRTFKTRHGSVEAVKGVDLSLEKGEIFGFLGPNGAGKTTTLRMLATLLPPSGGEATIAGADLLKEPGKVRERIGYVSQVGSSAPEVPGRKELVIQGRLYGMSRQDAEQRAQDLLISMELDECADRPTKTYSGGQKRRLDVAIGLMHLPELLFLDEPTTGLDPQSRARMWDEVRRLREGGTTVFLTTHYLEEADALCDRLAIIDHGTIVTEGTPDELKRQVAGDLITLGVGERHDEALALVTKQPYVREAGLEEDSLRLYVDRGETAMPQLLRLLDGAGIQLTTMAMARPSLDDVFLRQTGRSLREAAS